MLCRVLLECSVLCLHCAFFTVTSSTTFCNKALLDTSGSRQAGVAVNVDKSLKNVQTIKMRGQENHSQSDK